MTEQKFDRHSNITIITSVHWQFRSADHHGLGRCDQFHGNAVLISHNPSCEIFEDVPIAVPFAATIFTAMGLTAANFIEFDEPTLPQTAVMA
jgi:hypothetical protein